MKTSELIKKINKTESITAELMGSKILFFSNGKDEEFYKFNVNGISRGDGYSDFGNIKGLLMMELFEMMDILDEYIKTPVEERKDIKKYYVLMPMGEGSDGQYMYRKVFGGVGFYGYSDRKALERSDCNQFTEAEIRAIDKKYMTFAEEVK